MYEGCSLQMKKHSIVLADLFYSKIQPKISENKIKLYAPKEAPEHNVLNLVKSIYF